MSYESNKLGHQGWFFAGNELGAILAMSFGLVVYFVIMQTTSLEEDLLLDSGGAHDVFHCSN